MNFPDVHPIVVASHPRSGTHLLMDTLRRQFAECRSWKWPGERLDRLYCNIDELNGRRKILDEKTALDVLSRTQRPLIKTHAWPGFQKAFLEDQFGELQEHWIRLIEEKSDTFYIYRDVRDVMCSYHLFRKGHNKYLREMGYDVPTADCSLATFIRQSHRGVSRIRLWSNHVRSWLKKQNIKAIQFESLLLNPEDVLYEIGKKINCNPTFERPILPKQFSSIWESRFARMFGVRPESTAIISSEKRESWRDIFTEEDVMFFKEEAGGLLEVLGYSW